MTPEDILLAKLHRFRTGGGASETRWRDVEGIVRACFDRFDREYLGRSAEKLGVRDLLEKSLGSA